MNNKQKLKNCINVIACAVLVTGLLFVMFYKPRNVYDVVVLGDSNIGNFRDETSVTYILQEELSQMTGSGVKVFNGGYGGSTAIKTTGRNYNEASFVNLADSIVNCEYSKLLADAASRDDGDLTYYDQSLRDLAAIDFSKVKVLVVAYGTNDYLLDADAKIYADAVYESALRIQEKYSDMKIILVTPLYNEGKKPESESSDSNKKGIEEYAYELRKANSAFSIFDAFSAGIVSEENINERTLDGVHLNEEARRIYGEMLAEYVYEEYR